MSADVPPGGPPSPGPASGYRLSDAERDEAITALAEAYAEGRLDVEEFQQRMEAASRARFAPDLDALFVDLPHRTPAAAALPSRGEVRANRVGHPQRRRARAPWMFVPVLLVLLLAVVTHFWILLPIMFLLTRRAHHRAARSQWNSWGQQCGNHGRHRE